jgi:hypothetical protein
MIAFKEANPLKDAYGLLSHLEYNLHLEGHRAGVQTLRRNVCLVIAGILIFFEFALAASMFGALAPSFGGNPISGVTFALLIPVVVIGAHIKLHVEKDALTRFWLSRLATIGILLFAVSVSMMVALAVYDVSAGMGASGASSGPSGTFGDEAYALAEGQLATWFMDLVAPFPPLMFFIGMSFGLIVTIYVTSYMIGWAKAAHAILETIPYRSRKLKANVAALRGDLNLLTRLFDDRRDIERRLPIDLPMAYAQEAQAAIYGEVSKKRKFAEHRFAKTWDPNPLTHIFPPEQSIPARLTTLDEVDRAANQVLAASSVAAILQLLGGAKREAAE